MKIFAFLDALKMDLILNVDVSASVDRFLPAMRQFLADLLSRYTIAADHTQVAMITFMNPAVLNWNWQSQETSSYALLIQSINSTLADTTGSTVGTVDDGFVRAMSNVTNTEYDRESAINILLTLGDGDGSSSLPHLAEINSYARCGDSQTS